jgi:hypothetical protein
LKRYQARSITVLTVLQCLGARIGRAGEIDLILEDEAKIAPPADATASVRAYRREHDAQKPRSPQ